MSPLVRLRQGVALLWILAVMVGCVPVALCSRRGIRWCMVHLWARGFLRAAGVRLVVQPARPAWPSGPALIVSNHASLLDIPILCAAFGRAPRFVAKAELGRVPLLALYLRSTGALLVDRKRGRQAARTLDLVSERLAGDHPFCFFAEGGRRSDGHVHAFRGGAFRVAKRTGAAIIPVAIVGSEVAQPPGSLIPRSAHVFAAIGESITCGHSESEAEFAARARAVVAELHKSIGGKGLAAESGQSATTSESAGAVRVASVDDDGMLPEL
jgi:1-acyl-sn-glycerol-3-phosphate acyltransferase